MKRLKWNKQSIGLVVGLLAPIVSFLVMYLVKHEHISFGEYLKDRFYHKFEIPALAQVIETMP